MAPPPITEGPPEMQKFQLFKCGALLEAAPLSVRTSIPIPMVPGSRLLRQSHNSMAIVHSLLAIIQGTHDRKADYGAIIRHPRVSAALDNPSR